MAAFVDTSMGTCLAVPFYPNVTTGDFKREFEREHFNYFPELGQIIVNSLTVKLKSHFYHLPESEFLIPFFNAFQGELFLHADACSSCPNISVDRQGINDADLKGTKLAENNSTDCAVPEQKEHAGVTNVEKIGFVSPDCGVKTKEITNSNSNGSSEVVSVTGIINRYFSDFEEVRNSLEDTSRLPECQMGNTEMKNRHVRNLEAKKRRVRNMKTKKCRTRLEPNPVTPSKKPQHCPFLENSGYGMSNDEDSNKTAVWKRILMASVNLGLPGSSSKERPLGSLVFELSGSED